MSPEKLVYMANQIGKFFHSRPEAHAVADTADHLMKYWDPRMRREIALHFIKGGAGLDPIPLKAVEWIANETKVHHIYPAAVEGEE
jgi:formate dehydrogenase subunit delta